MLQKVPFRQKIKSKLANHCIKGNTIVIPGGGGGGIFFFVKKKEDCSANNGK